MQDIQSKGRPTAVRGIKGLHAGSPAWVAGCCLLKRLRRTTCRGDPPAGRAVGVPLQPSGPMKRHVGLHADFPGALDPKSNLQGRPSAARCSRSPAVSSPAPAASRKLAPPCVAEVDSTLAACI